MFLGHFAVGFAAKLAAPRVSLGTLFLAAQFVDLLWPTFLLLGWERVEIEPGATRVTPLDFVWYPLSHSLVMVLVWAVLLGCLYGWARHYVRGAVVVALGVVSHWLLDALVHRPDLPLVLGGGAEVGLGLWHSLPATLIVELLVFFVAVGLYVRRTVAIDRAGSIGLWGLVALLVAIYLGNLFGPPPPSVAAIAWVGEAQWLLVALGYWIDRHRTAGATLASR